MMIMVTEVVRIMVMGVEMSFVIKVVTIIVTGVVTVLLPSTRTTWQITFRSIRSVI